MRTSSSLLRLALGRRAPRLDGIVRVAGVTDDVTIRRDDWGIPHVEASCEPDAWFALGFCHGQDRAFQLESLLRVIRGTLAELVGPDGLAVDRLSRRVGLRRAALAQLAVLDPDVRANADAYAAGVTEGTTTGLPSRPHELVLLRGRSTAWDAADALGMSKLMALLLPANWDMELARLKLLQLDGPDALRALDPTYPEWLPVTTPPGVPAGPSVDRLAEDLRRLLDVAGVGGGSNNWAVAAARTSTGRPILANDPHLAPSTPPHFYLADLQCPAWHAVGASLVGTYGILIGHNDTAGWGLTAGFVDNTDLCLEEVGQDGRSVRRGDQFVECQVIQEPITVKGGPTLVEDVLITPEGPVIGPALDGGFDAISLRATWLEPRPMHGLLELVRCSTAEDFHTLLADSPTSSQNVVFATTDGHIGYQLTGEPPLRRSGSGVLPVSGRDPEAGWDDLVAFDELPRLDDPDCGWIATANAKPAVDNAGPMLGVDFAPGYRTARIGEVLGSRDDWDVAATAQLQLDVVSIPWRETRDVVIAAAEHSSAKTAVSLLASWDGRVAAGSAAATVFELLVVEMQTRIARAMAPHSADWALGRGATPLMPHGSFRPPLTQLLLDQPDGWFDRSWIREIADALDAVQQRLTDRYGEDPRRWAWGDVRPLRFIHPLGVRRPLDRIFNQTPLPGLGDGTTVAQAAVDPRDPTSDTFFTPGLRMVLDVGNWSGCRWALPGGQSGNPVSRHYDDQLRRFQTADGITIAWDPDEVSKATRHALRVRPARDARVGGGGSGI